MRFFKRVGIGLAFVKQYRDSLRELMRIKMMVRSGELLTETSGDNLVFEHKSYLKATKLIDLYTKKVNRALRTFTRIQQHHPNTCVSRYAAKIENEAQDQLYDVSVLGMILYDTPYKRPLTRPEIDRLSIDNIFKRA